MYLTRRDNNRFFFFFFRAPFWSNADLSTNTKIMKTDVQETENGYVIHMDLPGFDKENIQVELKDGYMTVSANKASSDEEQDPNGKYIRISDRKEAIAYAIHNGKMGDIIVLAGKGHEDYQEINGKKYPMDERVLIREILEEDAGKS